MAGAFLVSDFGLLVMILRAFSRDLPCCGDRTHCKKRLGIFATFLRLGALLGSFSLGICHFCCVFVPRFAIGELATIANRKKVAIRTDFFVSGLLGGPPRQCWDIVGSMRNGG